MSKTQEHLSTLNSRPRASAEAAQNEATSKPLVDLLKIQSLPPEQQDIFLFTSTLNLEQSVDALGHNAICAAQSSIVNQLFQLIGLSSPLPTKTIRRSLGRCFALVLKKGDRKILFDSINRLIAIINTGKGDKELPSKHAAVHCIGEIFKTAGDSAISLCNLSCTSLMRISKSAQNHVGLRAAILKALGQIIGSVKGVVDEGVARDIWKYARAAVSGDKAALVQGNACQCLEQLIRETTYFDTASDFENLKVTLWKTCDCIVVFARHAAASCLALALVKFYSEHVSEKSVPKIKKPKKPNRTQHPTLEEAEDDASRPGSPSAKKVQPKLELSFSDLLRQLSTQYVRSSTSNRIRAAITHCYVKVFKSLPRSLVESSYGQVADHFLTDILSSPAITHDRHRLLLTRKLVHKILFDCVGIQILGETGRFNAAKVLINNVLKNYPQVIKERAQPSKHALIGALDTLVALIRALGSAFAALADSCREALVQVLQHLSYSVQIHASYCLRVFIQACPHQLLQCASICMNSVNRELSLLGTGRQSSRRCVGFANGLATVLSVSPLQPLYSSLEISTRVLSLATSLLKSSSKADLRVSGVQIQVAWILIGGLMPLGPNFIKIHLSQLLLLWKNALPRPLTAENSTQRLSSEIGYLAHVRECALGSIFSFMNFNKKLITTDISKRIALLLQNTFEFLMSLPTRKSSDDSSQWTSSSLQLQDLILMVRRRVLQCYTKLLNFSLIPGDELLAQSNLLTFAVSLFADPESYTPGSLVSSIANSAGNFDSIWNIADNSGFGVTGFVKGQIIKQLPGEHDLSHHVEHLTSNDQYAEIDEALLHPINGAYEHDSIYIFTQVSTNETNLPDPSATEVVNSAIAFFASALPLQDPKVQEGVLEQIATFMCSPSLQRDPGRKAAITVNIAVAILGTLKVTLGEISGDPGDLKHSAVEKCMQDILWELILDQDPYIRGVAFEGIGRLCNNSGNTFTTNEVNRLIDTIVGNRDPHARAGCAMTLGSVHLHVGGMAAGYHLKKVHGILLSLCSDPSPVVHYCAIDALSKIANSAGLTFSGYVSSTLGLLAQLWTCDTHNEEVAAVATSNYELETPTSVIIGRCVDALLNVLGPDLQDLSKTRELMITLIQQFRIDELPLVRSESLLAMEHLYLYDSAHVHFASYVQQLQANLDSPYDSIQQRAVDGLYNLIRRNAQEVLKCAHGGLDNRIWTLLNEKPEHEGIRNTIQAWLRQTSLIESETWIVRLQHVLTMTSTTQENSAILPSAKVSAAPDLQDEEVAGFAPNDGKDQDSTTIPGHARELLRWQVRAFALNCLSDLIAMIGKDMDLDTGSVAGHKLQQKIADVIRIAFFASTSPVTELCIQGLRLIDQILVIFGSIPDPDFSEALLLEQYQAQISAALTPAFSANSSPHLASTAINVCATFIATGLVTEIDRMGRMLKLLVSTLEGFTKSTTDTAVGDLRGLSSNARTMVKMTVLSAWANLQIASVEQDYLVKVIAPYITRLTPLWLSSLQEFARLRFEPDISSCMTSTISDDLDFTYAALNRETLLKFYQDSWLKLVDAIASLIDQDSNFVFDALDGKLDVDQTNGNVVQKPHINYRDEPVAFFFVLFGISMEALVVGPGKDSSEQTPQTREILTALKKILRPSISGNAIFQDVVFSETMELLDRLALTEGIDVQLVIVDIARNLCMTHPSSVDADEDEENLSDDIEQLFELTRIIVLVLTSVLPNLAEPTLTMQLQLSDEAINLIQVCLESLVDAADIFPSIIKTDLHASILHIFATIFGTGACQAIAVPQALPALRRFLQSLTMPSSGPSKTTANQLLGFFHHLLSILANAQRRELDSAILCAKNVLLACTVFLTTSSQAFSPVSPLLSRGLNAMLDCLGDLGLARIAANCLRSIILINSKSPTDEAIARHLFPRLIHFALDSSSPDPENARPLVVHAVTSFATSLPSAIGTSNPRSAAFSIVLPMLLAHAETQRNPASQETATRLLELAASDGDAFRSTVARLSTQQRSFMEGILSEDRDRAEDGRGKGRGEKDDGSEPTIALKLDFGSA